MGTPKLLVIQPSSSDPPAALGEWLTEEGAELDVRHPPNDELPMGIDEYHGVVCLGGGMDVNADVEYPWLRSVRGLLAESAGTATPTLGVCLGAQLLAVATGGQVARSGDGPEAGPSLVSKKDLAFSDPLLTDLPLLLDVMQFHRDVIKELPNNAEILASSPRNPIEAFRMRGGIYGVQFHIETTPDMITSWVDVVPDVAAAARAGALTRENLAAVHTDISETWQPFAHQFVRLANGDILPATGHGRSLPLA